MRRIGLLIGVFTLGGCHLVAGYAPSPADSGVGTDAAAQPDAVHGSDSDIGDLDACDSPACSSFSPVPLPNGGEVRQLSLTPNHSDTLYAVVSRSRLFRSEDRATSWAPCGPLPGWISAVAAIPNQPTQVLVGVDDEVLLSTDSCQSWDSTDLHRPTYSLVALGERDYLVGTDDGLYRSNNGEWIPIASPLNGRRVDSIVADASGRHLFATASTVAVARSLDGANSWQPANQGLPQGDVMALAIDHSHPERAFMLLTEDFGLHRTTNSGDDWSKVEGLGGRTVAVDPNDSDFVAVYLWHRLTASSDGGDSFAPGDGRTPNMGDALVDELRFDPQETDRLYAATNAGLFVATNRDWRWTSANVGLNAWTINGIATDLAHDHLYLATPAGLLRSVDRGTTWSVETTGLGPKSFASAVALSPGDDTLWVTGEYIARSTDGGTTFEKVFTPGRTDNFHVNAIAGSKSRVYAGSRRRLLVSTVGTSSWVGTSIAGKTRFVNDIIVVPGEPTRVWVATTTGVFVSDETDLSFTSRNEGLGDNADVNTLVFLDDGQLLAGTTSGVYALAPTTSSWERRGLADTAVLDLLVRDGTVVAACAKGVYASQDRGPAWTWLPGLEEELPRSLGTDLDGNLLVGTTGYGLYRRRLP